MSRCPECHSHFCSEYCGWSSDDFVELIEDQIDRLDSYYNKTIELEKERDDYKNKWFNEMKKTKLWVNKYKELLNKIEE